MRVIEKILQTKRAAALSAPEASTNTYVARLCEATYTQLRKEVEREMGNIAIHNVTVIGDVKIEVAPSKAGGKAVDVLVIVTEAGEEATNIGCWSIHDATGKKHRE